MEYVHTIESPVGTLTAASDGENISGLWIAGQKYFGRTLGEEVVERGLPVFEQLRDWLAVYFSGREPDFTPPLMPKGSPFQQLVWKCLGKIPYGQTISYGELAEHCERERGGGRGSARAAGGAVGRNPVSIIIPCHRVIGKNGDLTGYAGGVAVKQKLLNLERGIVGT
jgi:methylated-DNA-[protein]-cysteine S-methyltransferase